MSKITGDGRKDKSSLKKYAHIGSVEYYHFHSPPIFNEHERCKEVVPSPTYQGVQEKKGLAVERIPVGDYAG